MGISVIQWGTGTTGKFAVREVARRSELDLVAVRVYDPAKAGLDAGTAVGFDPVGTVTTDDRAAVVGMDADVVLYMPKVERNLEQSMTDIVELLRSGKNVITTGGVLIQPYALATELGDAIAEACAAGGTTFLGLGIHPGFAAETLAPVLSRLSADVTRITVREVNNYATYPVTEMMFDAMGYGYPADDPTPMLADPVRAGFAFTGAATVLAAALGLTIRSTEGIRETRDTPVDLHVAAGLIKAGTVGAIRFGVRADCGGTELVVEHVTRMADDLFEGWPSQDGFHVLYEGDPCMTLHLEVGRPGIDDLNDKGCMATAMHAVHAIPAVVAAAPGVLDLATVAPFTGTWPA